MSDRVIPITTVCKWCKTPVAHGVYCDDDCRRAQRAYERREMRAKKPGDTEASKHPGTYDHEHPGEYTCPCGYSTDWLAAFMNHTCQKRSEMTIEEYFGAENSCESVMIWLAGGPADFISSFLNSQMRSLRIDRTIDPERTACADYRCLGGYLERNPEVDAHVSLCQGKLFLIRGRRPKKQYRSRSA